MLSFVVPVSRHYAWYAGNKLTQEKVQKSFEFQVPGFYVRPADY